jgi:hypothetical protein
MTRFSLPAALHARWEHCGKRDLQENQFDISVFAHSLPAPRGSGIAFPSAGRTRTSLSCRT